MTRKPMTPTTLAYSVSTIFLFSLLAFGACAPNRPAAIPTFTLEVPPTERVITAVPVGSAGNLNPSGDFIALGVDLDGGFSFGPDGNAEIVLLDVELARQKPGQAYLVNLTNHPANDFTPTWSPDGQRLAFRSSRDGNDEIYVMNWDGSGLTNLTNDPAMDISPAWSPDSARIAFARSITETNNEIFVMDADGSNVVRLTDSPSLDEYPGWSPDGSQIVFMSHRDANWEIYVMDADGSDPRRLTDNPDGDNAPAWSPDGNWIAYSAGVRVEGQFSSDIYAVMPDGSNPTALTNHPDGDDFPVWSPDGGQLAFISNRDGRNGVYLMNADGSDPQLLVEVPEGWLKLDWRPRP